MTVVRLARPGELDTVARVLRAAFEQYRPPPDAPISAALRAVVEQYLLDIADVRSRLVGTDLFVAEAAGAIVGAGTLYRPHQPLDYGDDRKPWPSEWAGLRLAAVLPDNRGQGIGRMLAEARIERARALGAPVVALHTSSVFAASRAMYRKLGWERAPEYDHALAPGLQAEAYILKLA